MTPGRLQLGPWMVGIIDQPARSVQAAGSRGEGLSAMVQVHICSTKRRLDLNQSAARQPTLCIYVGLGILGSYPNVRVLTLIPNS
jgi:hypothetical protein